MGFQEADSFMPGRKQADKEGMGYVRFINATLFLAAFEAGADGPKPCPQSFAQLLKSDVENYWKEETAPLTRLLRPLTSKQEDASLALLRKLPPEAYRAFKRSVQCADAGLCLANNGIKLGFAPVFLLWDAARVPAVMSYKAARGLIKGGTENPQQMLAMPLEIIYKNTPYIVGYSALTAVGWNVPNLLAEQSTTLIPELAGAAPQPEFKDKDLLVFVTPAGEKSTAQSAVNYYTRLRTKDRALASSQIVHLEVSKSEELIRKIGELRKKGRIKELVMVSHGSSGNIDFQSGGIKDVLAPKKLLDDAGELNSKTLKNIGPSISAWPKDLFAENASIQLVSCSVASGKDGKKFVQSMAGMMLQSGGTFVASPRKVPANAESGRDRKKIIEEAYAGSSSLSPLQQKAYGVLAYHFFNVPVQFLTSGGHVGVVYKGIKSLDPEDPVYVVPIGGKR